MLSHLNNFDEEATFDHMRMHEKEAILGQKMGYVPQTTWLCQEYVLHKQLSEFSLVVSSK